MVERLAVDVLHRDEIDSVHIVDVVNGDDIRVVQCRSSLRLEHETAPALRIGYGFGRQDFDCHGAVEVCVPGLVHNSHTALANLRVDAVVAQGSADHRSIIVQLGRPVGAQAQMRLATISVISSAGGPPSAHVTSAAFTTSLISSADFVRFTASNSPT